MAYHPAHDAYFQNQVFTAAPQKLRLMAIDGAIRYARQAAEHWRNQRVYEAGEALIGCQRLLVELLSALRPERAPELAGRVAGLYAYLSRLLNDARRARDPQRLSEVIEILEIERETWRLVCERLGAAPDATDGNVEESGPPLAGAQQAPHGRHAGSRPFTPSGFESFETGPSASGFTASA